MPALGRKQQAVLSFPQQAVEMEQSGRLQNDGGTDNACGAHENRAQAGDDTVPAAEVRRTLAAAIENQQLMPIRTDSATTERSPPEPTSRATVTIK